MDTSRPTWYRRRYREQFKIIFFNILIFFSFFFFIFPLLPHYSSRSSVQRPARGRLPARLALVGWPRGWSRWPWAMLALANNGQGRPRHGLARVAGHGRGLNSLDLARSSFAQPWQGSPSPSPSLVRASVAHGRSPSPAIGQSPTSLDLASSSLTQSWQGSPSLSLARASITHGQPPSPAAR